jgi:hypothetical protein
MVYEEIQHLITQANNQLPRHILQFGDMVANPQQVIENKPPRTHNPPKNSLQVSHTKPIVSYRVVL